MQWNFFLSGRHLYFPEAEIFYLPGDLQNANNILKISAPKFFSQLQLRF